MNIKDVLIDALKGFCMGVAVLIPGVSAATIALISKIYDKLITNIANLFKTFWPSLKALIPIGIGIIIAILAMWFPLKLATEHILFAVVCLFAGSMIGSVPDITDNIKHEPLKKRYALYLLLAILCGMSLGIMSYHLNIDVSALFNPIDWKLFIVIIPVGILSAAGVIVPGISGSMMLLVLGFYTNILGLVDKLKSQPGQAIGVLICMLVGIIVGMFFFSLLMKQLFKKAKVATYVWIIGLVVGSIFSLFYNHDIMAYYHEHGIPWWEGLLGAILLIGGFVGSYYLVIYQRKHQNENRQVSQ
ncbi:MAG: DUF368 domain-containing protein [Bacilli bacterium]|nr:DUF368 domain-containing protein [Bacilli bacterium]